MSSKEKVLSGINCYPRTIIGGGLGSCAAHTVWKAISSLKIPIKLNESCVQDEHTLMPASDTLASTNSFYVGISAFFCWPEMMCVEEQQSAAPARLHNTKLDAVE